MIGSGRDYHWAHSRPSPVDAEVLGEILRRFAWPSGAIASDPRGNIDEPVEDHWRYQLALFAEDDHVWVGRDIYDSGRLGHRSRFRPMRQWQRERECPGLFVCPSTFKPQVCSRNNDNVLQTKFLVVESDELDRDQVGAVFRWIEVTYPEMRLRAVVDTANKSLHGWFDFPLPGSLDDLRDYLPRLKCDPAMFTRSQPCRLAGALRDGKYQRLLYFNP